MTTNITVEEHTRPLLKFSLQPVFWIVFGIFVLPDFPHVDQQKTPHASQNFSGNTGKVTPMKRVETPKALEQYSTQKITKEMEKKKDASFDMQDISMVSYTSDFLLPNYVIFSGSKIAMPTFAYDRGNTDENSIYHRGLWSTSEKKEIQEAQYGQAFSRFELTKEEAISFWSSLVGVSEYVSTDDEGLFEGGGAAAPTWKKNVLHIYVESHVGMRGPVYDEYKVYFPKKASDAFKIEKK